MIVGRGYVSCCEQGELKCEHCAVWAAGLDCKSDEVAPGLPSIGSRSLTADSIPLIPTYTAQLPVVLHKQTLPSPQGAKGQKEVKSCELHQVAHRSAPASAMLIISLSHTRVLEPRP